MLLVPSEIGAFWSDAARRGVQAGRLSREQVSERVQGLESATGQVSVFPSAFREPTAAVSLALHSRARSLSRLLLAQRPPPPTPGDLMELGLDSAVCSRDGDTRPRLQASCSVDLLIIPCRRADQEDNEILIPKTGSLFE